MKEIVVLLLFIATLGGIVSFSVDEYGIIHNFRWPADAALMGTIPDHEYLSFKDVEVDILPPNLFDKFEKCIVTYFHGRVVKTIHISPKLMRIWLYSTSTVNVIIEREKHYQLEDFECLSSKLTSIPENIDQLKNLKHLNLNGNLIKTVQFNQLNGLDNLETLDLSNNKMKHIYNHGSVSLPSLTRLTIVCNRLKHIDVCSWNMPSLSFLNIHDNRLIHFAINHFLGVSYTISENPLNCDWMDSLPSNGTYAVVGEELTCDKTNEGVFGLDCPSSIDQLRQQNFTQIEDTLQSRLAQIEGTLLNNSKQIAEMNKKFQKMEQLLIHFSKKVIEQENVSNDIIEAIYRAEMERTYNTNQSP